MGRRAYSGGKLSWPNSMAVCLAALLVIMWVPRCAYAEDGGSWSIVDPSERSSERPIGAEDQGLAMAPQPQGLAPPAPGESEPSQGVLQPPVLQPPPPVGEAMGSLPGPYAPPTLAAPLPLLQGPYETQPGQYVSPTIAPGYVLFPDSCLERFGQQYAASKQGCCTPITVGAWHWWHINTGGPLPSGYGIPGETGTYYYSIEASPEWDCDVGSFTKMGAYADVRLRDGGTPFRPFYSSTIWPYQAYGWAYSDPGVLKAGLIWRRFGLDWDGSFWGSTPYYDGFMLATSWGLSWEVTPQMRDGWKVDRYFQFFFRDYIDGSLVDANPLSVPGSSERNTFVARLVPTMQLSCDETLALGISGMVGEIDNQLRFVGIKGPVGYPAAASGTEAFGAYAVDLTYTNGNFKTFVEGLQSFGTLSPTRYVSGGPSNRISDLLAGVNWTHGPVIYRFSYSLGLDSNPSGTQNLFVPGITVSLTHNVALYLDYVYQEIRHSGTRRFTTVENGIQAVLHWAF